MAVQRESQADTADADGSLNGYSSGARPKIIRAIDDEGGTTTAKVSRRSSNITLLSQFQGATLI